MFRSYRRTYPRLSKDYKELESGYKAINIEKHHGRMLPATAYECRSCYR